MANIHDCLEDLFDDIADAIREKHGISDKICADNFPSNIRAIETSGGGITPIGTKTITANGTHNISAYEFAEVNVSGGSGDVVASEYIEVGSLSELHSWSKYTPGGTVNETEYTKYNICYATTDSGLQNVDYADTYSTAGGKISLVNPTTVKLGSNSSNRSAIKGKYIYSYYKKAYFYVPTDATVAYSTGAVNKAIEVSRIIKLTYSGADGELVGAVVSRDSATFPQDGELDGYRYVYNGTLE